MTSKEYEEDGRQLKVKECFNCHTKETPLWRRSRKGYNLCNACGLYFRNHGEHRPISNITSDHIKIDRFTKNMIFLEKMAVAALTEMRSRVKTEVIEKPCEVSKPPFKRKLSCLEDEYNICSKEKKQSQFSQHSDKVYLFTSKNNSEHHLKNTWYNGIWLDGENKSRMLQESHNSIHNLSLSCIDYKKPSQKNNFQLTMRKGRPTLKEYKQMDEHASDELQDIVNRLVSFQKK